MQFQKQIRKQDRGLQGIQDMIISLLMIWWSKTTEGLLQICRCRTIKEEGLRKKEIQGKSLGLEASENIHKVKHLQSSRGLTNK
jgi:hypothetical protein